MRGGSGRWVRKGWLSVVLLAAASAFGGAGDPAAAGKLPPLWGYGVRSCADYSRALAQRGLEAEEYRRYRDWLTGFVSGLNLATGQDVLVGVEMEAAMRRIGLYCDEHGEADFFTATMDLVRLLSKLK